jgi:UDP-2,3-diacylglucosamine hydrolase
VADSNGPSKINGLDAALAAPLVVLSDVHLIDMNDPRAEPFMNVLRGIRSSSVECLALLGDIFEFCVGSRPLWQRKFAPIGEELRRIAALGVRVLVFEGNHDFILHGFGWPGVEFVPTQDLVVTLKAGPRVRLSHGDLIHSSPDYRRFRALVKHPLTRIVSSFVPATWLDGYSMFHARHSRRKGMDRVLDIPALTRDALAWRQEENADFAVFGHFHQDLGEEARRQGIYCLHDWATRAEVLVWRDGKFEYVPVG